MPAPKAHHWCQATHPTSGERCKLEHGPQHHKMAAQPNSDLGLPMPVHELDDGTTWYRQAATTTVVLDLGDIASGALTRRPT
jgi:hypothetical protein